MNADPAAQQNLLAVADLDAELARTAHRRETLPELAEITEAGIALQEGRDAMVMAETAASDLDRSIRKLEAEIEQVRARENRDRSLLASGSISSGKQLEDLEHELATLERRQSSLEDDQLELMEQREAVDVDLEKAKQAVADAEARVADATVRRDAAVAELDASQTKAAGERESLTGGLPADLLALYERIRSQKGTGAALLRQRRCGSCRLELDRTAIAAIKDSAPDSIQRCEECGVILVRTSESGL